MFFSFWIATLFEYGITFHQNSKNCRKFYPGLGESFRYHNISNLETFRSWKVNKFKEENSLEKFHISLRLSNKVSKASNED